MPSILLILAVVATLLTIVPIQKINAECPSLTDCTLQDCQYGLAYDENECNICQCLDPCQNVTCAVNEVCNVEEVQCVRAPCPPRGYCSQGCPNLEGCMKDCHLGYAFDSNGCYICECYEPCKNITCSADEECQIVWRQCIKEPCPPLGVCAPKSTGCPSMAGCTLNCQYGLAYDQNECNICQCLDPCKNVNCSDNEECQVQQVQCFRAPCPPMGFCNPKPTGEITPVKCPYMECELIRCQYGFKYDSLGCKTCNCFIPCETYECPVGQQCTVGPSGCTGGENCRGEWQVSCVVETPPSVTRTIPSAADLLGCCVSKNMSQNCQSLCVPDITVTAENVGTVLQCMDQMQIYRNCAGGDQISYSQCCQDKMAWGTCDLLCAANVQVDSIYRQRFTSCLLSEYINDALSCIQRGLPDAQTTTITPMYGSTTRVVPQICLQEPLVGPCKAYIDAWHYNPSTGNCEMFVYGGCLGNDNNFETKDACDAACKTDQPPCPQIMCAIGCDMVMGDDGCNKCSCNGNCPAVRCSRECQYGVQKDANGCNSCDCVDPCIATTCPTGYVCTYKQQPVCEDDICRISYRAQCTPSTVACPTMNCSNSCSYGRVKDGNKCETCECANPCKDVSCEIGYTCKITSALTCVGETCEMRHVGMCAVPCLPPPCNSEMASCEYGFVKDANGCDMCECYDPCNGVTCREGQVCVKKTIPTYIGDDGGIREVFVGQCELPQNATCPDNMCMMHCDYELIKDNNGCDVCQCFDPCQNLTCAEGKHCLASNIMPTKEYPYGFIGHCVDDCSDYAMCEMYCPYGFQKDSNGCNACRCYDPCANVNCTDSSISICNPRRVEKTPTNPYEYIGECIECTGMICRMACDYGTVMVTPTCSLCECFDPCKDLNCTGTQHCSINEIQPGDDYLQSYKGQCVEDITCSKPMCTMYCEYGLVKDSYGCEICRCFDPCQSLTCGEGKHCEAVSIRATREYPYSYIGRCVRNDGCSDVMCEMFCPYGRQKDSNGCDMCSCSDPCANVSCTDSSISICHPRFVPKTDDRPYDSYIGECIQCTGMTCRIGCEYGTVMVTENCPLCECFEPCKDVNCTYPQKCVVKEVPQGGDYLQSYMGQCEGGCRPRGIMCKFCEYGYEMDENGCETCNCYNPCSLADCRDGMNCVPIPDPQCTTGNCRYLPSCVPTLNQCAYDMQQNVKRYAQNLAEMPELNCDMAGFYKPMQCENQLPGCYCTSPLGQTTYVNLGLQDAISACFPNDKILGTLKIEANFNSIASGQGAYFKQTISKQLADALLVDDSNITITQYYAGSIMADFVIANLNHSIMNRVDERILQVQGQHIIINYNGAQYSAHILNFRRLTPTQSPPTREPPSHGGLSRAGFLVLVILLPIVGALILTAALAFCIYKMCQRRGSFEPMSNRSSMSFDAVMDKGQRPTAGYDNPNYEAVKVPLE